MSGSNRKKERKEQSNEVLGERKRQETAKAQKEQQLTTVYKAAAVVVVILVAALLLWSNNPFKKQPVAMTVNGQDFTLPEVAFYYNNMRQYESMMANWGASSFSPYLPDNAQLRIAAQEAGVDDNGNQIEAVEAQTFEQYFSEAAIMELESTTIWYNAAVAAGASTLSAEAKAEIDASMRQIDVVCRQNSISMATYFRQVFGEGMNKSLYISMMEKGYIADAYNKAFTSSHEVSDDEIMGYYNENKNTYDLVSYNVFFVDGTPEEKLDNEDNVIDSTDAEITAAMRVAKATGDEVVAAVESGTSFYDAALIHDLGSDAILNESYYLKSKQTMSVINGSIAEWLYAANRNSDDVTCIESTSGYYVVQFLDRLRDDVTTASIRHILIYAESTEYAVDENGVETAFDSESLAEGEEKPATILKPSEEQWAAARAEIDRIEQEWLDAGGSEETFAELANKYSDDGGSNTLGGLYEGGKPGSFVPNFDDWVFAAGRVTGDYGIVQNDGDYFGCHLIYYVGDGQPEWMIAIGNTLKANASQAWYDAQYEQISSTIYPDELAKLGA